jgi:hypothetical protein
LIGGKITKKKLIQGSWKTVIEKIAKQSTSSKESDKSVGSRVSTPSSSTHNTRLTDDDKSNIRELYDSLDESKMWKLLTGTIVEKKMKEFSMT